MATGNDRGDDETGTEIESGDEPIRVYSPTRGRWEYSNDELDPRTAARMDREWRAMPAREKRKAIAGALLVLSPVILMFALMPFALAAQGDTREMLERTMAMLLLGQLVVVFLVVGVAKLLPKRKGAEEPRKG